MQILQISGRRSEVNDYKKGIVSEMSRFGLQGIFIFLASFVLVACDSGEDNVLNNLAPEALNVSIVDNNGTVLTLPILSHQKIVQSPELISKVSSVV